MADVRFMPGGFSGSHPTRSQSLHTRPLRRGRRTTNRRAKKLDQPSAGQRLLASTLNLLASVESKLGRFSEADTPLPPRGHHLALTPICVPISLPA